MHFVCRIIRFRYHEYVICIIIVTRWCCYSVPPCQTACLGCGEDHRSHLASTTLFMLSLLVCNVHIHIVIIIRWYWCSFPPYQTSYLDCGEDHRSNATSTMLFKLLFERGFTPSDPYRLLFEKGFTPSDQHRLLKQPFRNSGKLCSETG